MGKNKKKFIDRKNAVTFHLVHRSQHDPLITDETAPQHVLVETVKSQKTTADIEKRKKEQQKYGIFYDDDYDYLQHLKEAPKQVVWEYVEAPNQRKSKTRDRKSSTAESADNNRENNGGGIQLPSSVFATEFEETEGVLNKAAPCPGPRPDWDPDIVAALDDDFDFNNPDNQLEDDFVCKAMVDQVDDDNDEEGSLEFDENDEYDVSSEGLMSDDEGELNDKLGPLMRKSRNDDFDTKSRFTEYSLSSSVIRRNEQLQLLDERFEKFYEQYDDPEIGALDLENIEGHVEGGQSLLMNVYQLHKKNSDLEKYNKDWDRERLKKYLDVDNPDENDNTDELVEIEVEEEKKKKWDCESILSTYSNIYNHPKLIKEPQRSKKHSSSEPIQIDSKTGMPMNVLKGKDSDRLTSKSLRKLGMNIFGNDEVQDNEINFGNGPKSLCSKSVISTLSVLSIRPKDETPEEKKERKKLLKEYRLERRIEKKANTEAFKEEKKRQQKIKINNQNNIQGNRIL